MSQTEQSPSLLTGAVYLESNGFILRCLAEKDVTPELLTWFNDPELLDGLNLSGLKFTLESLAAMVRGFNQRTNYLIGIFTQDEKLLGFYTLDINPIHKVCLITAGSVRNSHTSGREFMWKTIDALLDHFFEERGIEKFTSRVLSTNRRVLFMMQGSTRFVLEAKLYKDCVGANGDRVDVLLFSSFKNPEDNIKGGKVLI